jgi:GT2 family glycosyltransferase
VIVLAWNQLRETLECLESLQQTHYENLHLSLVDNGSSDGTADVVTLQFPQVEVLRLEKNVGIARGYNTGIENALANEADFVLVMNNDTVIAPDMVNELVDTIQQHPNIGMVMPKIYNYYGEPNRLWCAGAKWQLIPPRIKQIGANAPDGPRYSKPFTVEYAPSCCLLIRSKVLEEVGAFDPSYYFYFDDWDLSARIRAAGYGILFVPQAHLWHKVAVTTRKSEKPTKWWFVMGQSSVRFYLQHKSPTVLTLHTLWFVVREIIKLKLSRVLPFLFGVANGLAEHWGWQT